MEAAWSSDAALICPRSWVWVWVSRCGEAVKAGQDVELPQPVVSSRCCSLACQVEVGSRAVVRTLATCSCGCPGRILRARRDRVDPVGWWAVFRSGGSSTRGATRRETSMLVWWVEAWRGEAEKADSCTVLVVVFVCKAGD